MKSAGQQSACQAQWKTRNYRRLSALASCRDFFFPRFATSNEDCRLLLALPPGSRTVAQHSRTRTPILTCPPKRKQEKLAGTRVSAQPRGEARFVRGRECTTPTVEMRARVAGGDARATIARTYTHTRRHTGRLSDEAPACARATHCANHPLPSGHGVRERVAALQKGGEVGVDRK